MIYLAEPKKFLIVEENIDLLSDDTNEFIVVECQLPPDQSGCIRDEEGISDNSFEMTTAGNVYDQIELFINKLPEVSDEKLDTSSTSKIEVKSRTKKKTTIKIEIIA